MNSTSIIVRSDILGIAISFSYERTGVGRNLGYAGRICFDGSEVENRGHVGKSPREAEVFMRAWCERLTEADVVRIANEEVEGERAAIAEKLAELEARLMRAAALEKKLAGTAG